MADRAWDLRAATMSERTYLNAFDYFRTYHTFDPSAHRYWIMQYVAGFRSEGYLVQPLLLPWLFISTWSEFVDSNRLR